MTNRSDFSQFLLPFIDQAQALGDQGLMLIDQHLPEDLTGAVVPESTVHRLHIVSTVSYRSGLLCLMAPETSLSAVTLLRGILEAWSHLAFIRDDTAGGDAPCRALRYERGAMKEWEENVRVAPAAFDKDTWFKQHDEKKREIEALWKESGYKGANRTQGQAAQTLATLAKQPGMDWVTGAWRSTSAATHMYGVDFAFASRGDGTSDLVWALPSHRASWLMLLAGSYGCLTTTAAEILQPNAPATIAFHNAVKLVAENSDLRRALTGRYDKES